MSTVAENIGTIPNICQKMLSFSIVHQTVAEIVRRAFVEVARVLIQSIFRLAYI